MGMITRVRGRLRSFQGLSKMDPQEQHEKIAETVSLLSVLFLLPYCTRGHSPILISLGGWCMTSYTFLVLPVLISANYKYPARWLRNTMIRLISLFRRYSKPTWLFLCRVYSPIDRCEKIFAEMSNISNLATQLVFFMACDKVLLCGLTGQNCQAKKFTGLYTVMFYNVLSYSVNYIKEMVTKKDWSVTVNMTKHSNMKHVAMSATKIVLEWTKAVTFIITIAFMILVFQLEQGLENYQPTALYTIVTWTYYMCTEKVFVELFLPFLLCLKLQRIEALEAFYAPVLLRCYTISLAVILVVLLSINSQLRFIFLAFYLTVYLKAKDLFLNSWRILKKEKEILGQFRNASEDEIQGWDDVCAVCLSPMERARVTPCNHFFHANCLRQCLSSSQICPICKREYTFVH